MPNPFFDGRAGTYSKPNTGSSSNNLKDIYKILSKSNNPMQVFQNIAQNNPRMAPIMDLLNKGYSPEQVFNAMCQQRGLNPQEFIKSITG